MARGMKTYRGGSAWDGATWPGDPGTADETVWQYEPASGLFTNKLYADGNGTAYSYTPEGKLATRRWARGVTTTYSYTNTTGEMIGIDYSDSTPDVGFTYLRMGQQGTITDGEGTRTLTYDPRLQLSNEVQVLTGNLGTNIISRATDSLGRNTGFRLEQNESVVCESAYSYATDGRFNGVAWSNAGMSVARSVQYQYLPQSELLAGWTESDAGFTTVREYEPQRDLLVTVSNRIGTNVVSVFGYQNDVIGRRTKRYDGGSAFTAVVTNLFGYNTRSELTNAVMGDLLYGFRFDNIGNREWSKTNGTELTYVANELNQYTQIANGVTNNPTYDLDGNLLTDGTWTNTWDGENRLVGVTPLNVVTGSKKLQMAYDYMGRRVRKAVLEWDGSSWQTNKTSRFVFDGWNLLSEYSVLPSSVQTNWFVWGLDLSGSLQGAGGIGGLISSQLTDPATSNRVTVLYTFDGNGNVSECLTPDGGIVAHYEYSPFAALFSSTGRMAKTNPFRFSTKWWDDETGLGLWGMRYYHPDEGTWISRDPIGELGMIVLLDAASGRSSERAAQQARRAAAVAQIVSSLRSRGHNDLASSYESSFSMRAQLETPWAVAMQGTVAQMHPYAFVDNSPISDIDLLGLACVTERNRIYDFTIRRVLHRWIEPQSSWQFVAAENMGYNDLVGTEWLCRWKRDILRKRKVRETRYWMYIILTICTDSCGIPSVSVSDDTGSSSSETVGSTPDVKNTTTTAASGIANPFASGEWLCRDVYGPPPD